MEIMTRLIVLLAALAWQTMASSQGESPQHVLQGSQVNEPSSTAAKLVRKKLKEAEIIPTVIDDFKPSLGLHVTWPSKEHALLGNTLTPKKLQDEPSIALHDIQAAASSVDIYASNVSYVVTLTDPDAPSRDKPKWSEFCHWIASGVLKPALCDPKDPGGCPPVLSDLDEVMSYKPPGPPKGTGKHRYVFLAFVPSNGTTDKLHLAKPSGRKHWGYDAEKGKTKGVRQWAAENGLAPVGANFIYAENE